MKDDVNIPINLEGEKLDDLKVDDVPGRAKINAELDAIVIELSRISSALNEMNLMGMYQTKSTPLPFMLGVLTGLVVLKLITKS